MSLRKAHAYSSMAAHSQASPPNDGHLDVAGVVRQVSGRGMPQNLGRARKASEGDGFEPSSIFRSEVSRRPENDKSARIPRGHRVQPENTPFVQGRSARGLTPTIRSRLWLEPRRLSFCADDRFHSETFFKDSPRQWMPPAHSALEKKRDSIFRRSTSHA